MGGGFFNNIWDPYSSAYAHPRFRHYRPRADHYGVPEGRSIEEPVNQKTVKTVKIIPVTDGGALDAKPAVKSEDAAATEIQALYRRYLVRKTQPLQHLRVIKKVKGELESLKLKSQETEQKSKLCSDSKERLRWTEGVLALLLRLDSLQDVHPEVRLKRKAVTKELIDFQETIDSMSCVPVGLNDVIPGKTIENSAATAPEVVKEMEIEDNISNVVEQDIASVGACENGSDGQGFRATEDITSEKHITHSPSSIDVQFIDSVAPYCDDEYGSLGAETTVDAGVVSDSSSSKALAEAPLDVENRKQLIMRSPTHRVEESEVEPASLQNLSPEIDYQEASGEGNSAVTDMGRREESEVDMSRGDVNGFTGDDPARLDEKESTGAGSTDGCLIPASNSMQSMSLKSLQGGQPQPVSAVENKNALSEREYLLQLLEENRNLKDVVGQVLHWGKQQSDVIHFLSHRVAQLEEHQPPSILSHGEDNNGRKRVTNGVCPQDNGRRSRRRLEKDRRNRRRLGYFDSEDWLSAEC